ncbi:MAG: DUF58 domain-containing protein [Burkholderiales bacterium]|nr:DUF58 domain-containing protein [Phycisphaerae bacterium]
MHVLGRLLDPQLVEQLSRLSLSGRRVVDGAAVGQHKSPVKGASIEFRQHRAYVPGDEPRRVDWRLLARSDRVFVKEYDEETNLRATTFLDASGSMAYGAPARKFDYATRLSAALGYLMLAHSESAGLAIAGSDSNTWLAPSTASDQLTRMVHLLERAVPRGATVLGRALGHIADRLGRRSLVIVISDCLLPASELLNGLGRLVHDRHEVVLVRLLHEDEINFPFQSWVRFSGTEGEAAHMVEAPQVRRKYIERFERHERQLHEGCSTLGIETVRLETSLPLIDAVTAVIRRRRG